MKLAISRTLRIIPHSGELSPCKHFFLYFAGKYLYIFSAFLFIFDYVRWWDSLTVSAFYWQDQFDRVLKRFFFSASFPFVCFSTEVFMFETKLIKCFSCQVHSSYLGLNFLIFFLFLCNLCNFLFLCSACYYNQRTIPYFSWYFRSLARSFPVLLFSFFILGCLYSN